MKTILDFIAHGGWIIIVTALFGIIPAIVIIRGFRNAKEIDDSSEGLTGKEAEIYYTAEDRMLSERIDEWGRKEFGEHSPENLDIAKSEKRCKLHRDLEQEQPGEIETDNVNIDYTRFDGK